MTEADIKIIMQGAKEKYPEARPRIISDNGPQFIAKDAALAVPEGRLSPKLFPWSRALPMDADDK